ncbi:fungal-specific transcription factor domain-containing protein [Dipodascopsis uninucleata]
MQACDRCHTRKIKCDRRLPACGPCLKAGKTCQHTDRVKQRTYPRGYIERLEDKIKALELLNGSLQKQLLQNQPTEADTASGCTAKTKQSMEYWSDDRNNQNTSHNCQSEHEDDRSDRKKQTFEDEIDEVTSVASYLSLTAAGDTRYLGSSSGVLFAQIVSSMIISSARRRGRSHTDHILAPQFAPLGSSTEDEDEDADGKLMDITNDITNTDSDVGKCITPELPRRSVVQHLLKIYFTHIHISFPFLSEHETLEAIDRIYNDTGYYRKNVFWSFVFDMILAIATSTVQKYEWNLVASPESYSQRATQKLNRVLCLKGTKPLIAVLLLSVYSLMHDTSASVWHLVGIAVRLCMELGLHRDSGREQVSFFETEMRRRCFWCVFALDRMVSVTLGRPLGINDNDIDVSLPTSHTDECLWSRKEMHKGDIFVCTCPSLSPFVHILGMRDLSGKILCGLYSNCPEKVLSSHEELRKRLDRLLESWNENISMLNLLKPISSTDIHDNPGPPVSCFADESWYHLIYFNNKLLLHRPSLVFKHASDETIFTILEASRGSLNIYSSLHRSRRLNYSWLTLHAVFMAGLSYLYSIAKLMYNPKNMKKLPRNLTIIDETRSCSNVLTAICERWNSSRDCQIIFDRLSGLILAEVLERQAAYQRQFGSSSFEAASSPPFDGFSMSGDNLGSSTISDFSKDTAADSTSDVRSQELRDCLGDLQTIFSNDSFFSGSGVVMSMNNDWLGLQSNYTSNKFSPECSSQTLNNVDTAVIQQSHSLDSSNSPTTTASSASIRADSRDAQNLPFTMQNAATSFNYDPQMLNTDIDGIFSSAFVGDWKFDILEK